MSIPDSALPFIVIPGRVLRQQHEGKGTQVITLPRCPEATPSFISVPDSWVPFPRRAVPLSATASLLERSARLAGNDSMSAGGH